MTVLLVLFTLIMFLAADYVIQKKRQKELGALAMRSAQQKLPEPELWNPSDDVVLASNHVWMRRERDNSITLGIDNFLLGLTGNLDKMAFPQAGDLVGKGSPAIELHHKGKALRVDSPIEGQVLETNVNIANRPAAAANPYSAGWLFKIVPFDSAVPLSGFMRGATAVEWLKKQNASVKEFLSAHLPTLEFVTMQDGGVPVDGVLNGFNQDVWNEFQHRFASLPMESETTGEYDNV